MRWLLWSAAANSRQALDIGHRRLGGKGRAFEQEDCQHQDPTDCARHAGGLPFHGDLAAFVGSGIGVWTIRCRRAASARHK